MVTAWFIARYLEEAALSSSSFAGQFSCIVELCTVLAVVRVASGLDAVTARAARYCQLAYNNTCTAAEPHSVSAAVVDDSNSVILLSEGSMHCVDVCVTIYQVLLSWATASVA
jgi:hypothetical protein